MMAQTSAYKWDYDTMQHSKYLQFDILATQLITKLMSYWNKKAVLNFFSSFSLIAVY